MRHNRGVFVRFSIWVHLLSGFAGVACLLGCGSGTSCGGAQDDVIVLDDGGTRPNDDDETTEFDQLCSAVCSVAGGLNDDLRESCGCEEPTACPGPDEYFHAPGSRTCETFSDGCNLPRDWLPCHTCLTDEGELVGAFSSRNFSTYDPERLVHQCYCDGDTGELRCQVVPPTGCYSALRTPIEEVGIYTLLDGCSTCYCDGYDSRDCTNEGCADCALDGVIVQHGYSYHLRKDHCTCRDGELSCYLGCLHGAEVYTTFEERLSEDGCEHCECQVDGDWICTDLCIDE